MNRETQHEHEELTTLPDEAFREAARDYVVAEIEAWQILRADGVLEEISEIKCGLDEVRSGAPGVPHKEVEKWVRSWGTDHELPRPTPKQP